MPVILSQSHTVQCGYLSNVNRNMGKTKNHFYIAYSMQFATFQYSISGGYILMHFQWVLILFEYIPEKENKRKKVIIKQKQSGMCMRNS